jgi:hypothetical protein
MIYHAYSLKSSKSWSNLKKHLFDRLSCRKDAKTCPTPAIGSCTYTDYEYDYSYCEEMIPGDAERVQNAVECEDELGGTTALSLPLRRNKKS